MWERNSAYFASAVDTAQNNNAAPHQRGNQGQPGIASIRHKCMAQLAKPSERACPVSQINSCDWRQDAGLLWRSVDPAMAGSRHSAHPA